MKKSSVLLALVFMLCACNLRDEFFAPEIKAPAKFKEVGNLEGKWKQAKPAENIDKGQWWKVFDDAKLNKLMEELAVNNNDLAAASARVKQFAARGDFAKAEQLPNVSGYAGANRQKISKNTTGGTFNPDAYNTFGAGVEVAYEVDIMGKISNNVLAVGKDFESAEAAYKNVLLILQANLAQNYFALRAKDSEAKLVKAAVELRTEQIDIIKKREQLGAASGLDVKLAETDLANIKLQALELDKQRANLEHSLAILLGKAPAEFDFVRQEFKFSQPKIPVGLAADVLQRRPDIAAAIRSLEAENARVGIARAAFFPDITLTASGGLTSEQLGDLFKWSSRTWLVGPASAAIISGAIYDGGRYFANREGAEAKYEEAVANYRQQVLQAFKEVEDNLSDLAVLNDQLKQAEIARNSADDAQRITQIKYDAGAISYFDLKDAQVQAISAQRQQINTQLQASISTVSLIKAIGGSW